MTTKTRVRKTPLMKRIEHSNYGRPIEQILLELANREQLNDLEIAAKLQVSKSAINQFRLQLGIRVERVWLLPNQRIQIVTETR